MSTTLDGQIVIDPDEQVRSAVADLFAAFARTGSAYGVVTAFAGPARSRSRLRRGVGRSAAVGPADPRPGAGHPEQPRVRRCLRLRPLPERRPCRAGRHRPRPAPARRDRVAGPDPGPPRGLHQLGAVPGQRGRSSPPNQTNTGARPPREGIRCVRASSTAAAAGSGWAPATKRQALRALRVPVTPRPRQDRACRSVTARRSTRLSGAAAGGR